MANKVVLAAAVVLLALAAEASAADYPVDTSVDRAGEHTRHTHQQLGGCLHNKWSVFVLCVVTE